MVESMSKGKHYRGMSADNAVNFGGAFVEVVDDVEEYFLIRRCWRWQSGYCVLVTIVMVVDVIAAV